MKALLGIPFEDIYIGQTACFSKTITEADILMFSAVSGDTNPMHLDSEFAKHTQFEGRIAHGMLTASLISTVVGTKLPGPGCIYVSQSLKFRAPVRIGDTVTASLEVTAIDAAKRRVTLKAVCHSNGVDVLRGESVVLVPQHPDL